VLMTMLRDNPIPVPGDPDRVLKVVQSEKSTIDTERAWPIVTERLGSGGRQGVVKISKTAYFEAIMDALPRGEKGKGKKEAEEELRAAGALTISTTESVRKVRRT